MLYVLSSYMLHYSSRHFDFFKPLTLIVVIIWTQNG